MHLPCQPEATPAPAFYVQEASHGYTRQPGVAVDATPSNFGVPSSEATVPIIRAAAPSEASTALDEDHGGPGSLCQLLEEEAPGRFGVADESYIIHELLGEGSFGSVHLCSATSVSPLSSLSASSGDACEASLPGSQRFAVKIISVRRVAMLSGACAEDLVPRLRREVEVLHRLGEHPHIVTLHRAFFSRESLKFYLVYELLEGGDLFHCLIHRQHPFTDAEAAVVFKQIVEAVSFCHERGVAHRDLKLDNCLLESTSSLSVKLCDFGQALFLGTEMSSKTLTTAPSYTAPEVWKARHTEESYDAFKADCYGLGVILFGLLCMALPRPKSACDSHPNWRRLTESARDLVQKLLEATPEKRLSIKEILEHAWLSKTPPSLFHRREGPDKSYMAAGVEAFLSTQHLVLALQRERGSCIWALSDDEGKQQFCWRLELTDKQLTTAEESLRVASGALRDFEPETSTSGKNWSPLQLTLEHLKTSIPQLRALARPSLTDSTEENIQHALHGYSDIILGVIESMSSALRAWCTDHMHLQHHVLTLAAEQLGLERAFLVGHLTRPENLRSASVVRRSAEIIGARKLLLGSSRRAQGLIVGGGCGLISTLGLAAELPLDAKQLAALEEAEDRVLEGPSAEVPRLSEWFVLLTSLIDTVHSHASISILGIASVSRVNSTPASSNAQSPITNPSITG